MAVPSPEQASHLKSLVDDLEETVYNLRVFEIHCHCDDLIGQITLTIDSAIEHLNQVKTKMTNQTNDYRTRLVDKAEASKSSHKLSPAQEEFKKLSKEFQAFKPNASISVARDLASQAVALRRQMRAEAFGSKFLRLVENDFLKSDIIGTLAEINKDVLDDLSKY